MANFFSDSLPRATEQLVRTLVMPDDQITLNIAPDYPESKQPVFKNRAEVEHFWQEFHSKVKGQLEQWDAARAQSEEDARQLWLRNNS